MALTAALESNTKRQQNKSTVDSFALEIAALLPRLRYYALHLTHNAAAADDLVQETVLRGIENIHLWRQGTDLQARLFTIMHNLQVSGIRRAVRYSTVVESTYAELSPCVPRVKPNGFSCATSIVRSQGCPKSKDMWSYSLGWKVSLTKPLLPASLDPVWQTTTPTTGVPSGIVMRTMSEANSSGAAMVRSRKRSRTSFAFSIG